MIFLSSYFGYKRRLNQKDTVNDISVKPKVQKVIKSISPEEKSREKIEAVKIKNPVTKQEVVKSFQSNGKKTRFEVFKPTKEKKHHPKILKINISKNKNSQNQ
jgi:hypothetical protein